MPFHFPSREEKRLKKEKGEQSYSFKEYGLLLLKSQEYSEMQALILYYFSQKYKDSMIAFFPDSFIQDVKNRNKYLKISRKDFQIIWLCDGHGGGKLSFPLNFWESFEKNKDKERFYVISCHLWTCPRSQGGHASILIYKRDTNTVERFEPNGLCAVKDEWYDSPACDRELGNMFLSYNIKYLSPQSPEKGWQRLQIESLDEISSQDKERITKEELLLNEGFCVVWTYVFLEIVIQNPNLTTKKIHNILVNELTKNSITYLTFIKTHAIGLIKNACNLFH